MKDNFGVVKATDASFVTQFKENDWPRMSLNAGDFAKTVAQTSG